MAAIVAPTIVRYTVNATYQGEAVANVLDFELISTNPLEQRSQHINELAGDILNNWDDHIRPIAVSAYVCQSVSWVDLDNLDGETGERTSTADTTWPASGGDPGAGMPANVACRVDKSQDGGRRARNGRMYLVGHSEAATDVNQPNRWTAARLGLVGRAVDDFLAGVNSEAGPDGREQAMVVVHTVDDEFVDFSLVTDLTVRSLIATQRRRLPSA